MSQTTRLLKSIVLQELEQFELFLGYMPNPDIFFEQTGETIEVYNRMLMDDEIGSSLDLRKRMLLSYPYAVSLPAGENGNAALRVQQFVKEALSQMNLTKTIEQMLTALEFGYSVNELIWDNPKDNDGKWLIKEAMLIKPERFGFDPYGRLILLSLNKRLDERYKLIVHRHGITAENPYGLSALRRCYWPWTFKRAGWKFWLIAAEKFGVPTIVAMFDAQDEEEAKRRAKDLAEMLSTIQTDAALAVANVNDIKTIESAKGIEGFKTLIEMCNRSISKAITGQTLASIEGQYGTRAQADVHERMLREIVRSDARAVSDTINKTLIPWLAELNFGKGYGALLPRFEFDLSDETPWERIKDAIDRGIPLSKGALYAKYGLPEPEDDEDVFIVSPKEQQRLQPDDEGSGGGAKEMADDFFGQAPRQRAYLNIW